MSEKTYVKVFCPKVKRHGLVTIEKSNGQQKVTNFYEIDDDTAKNVVTAYEGKLPEVSMYLKPCASTGSRTPRSVDLSHRCPVKKGELWYQCLYCSALDVCQAATGASGLDIYFLMDESGSMQWDDRREAANAVRRLVESLTGSGNTYSFVSWGSTAGYIFRHETHLQKMNGALNLYESGNAGHSGSTDAAVAFRTVKEDVRSSHKPVYVIFVTDGYLDDDDEAMSERNELLRGQKKVDIMAIGTEGANQATLEKIGTIPAFSKVVGSSKALTSTFEQIAAILKKKGNNF